MSKWYVVQVSGFAMVELLDEQGQKDAENVVRDLIGGQEITQSIPMLVKSEKIEELKKGAFDVIGLDQQYD